MAPLARVAGATASNTSARAVKAGTIQRVITSTVFLTGLIRTSPGSGKPGKVLSTKQNASNRRFVAFSER